MKKGKTLLILGYALMIGSLAFMTLSLFQGESMNPIIVGLLGVSGGNLLHHYGKKLKGEDELA